ncbi:DNA-binding response regulator [Siphonobacter sp. BAB-5385]|uniref:LytR/AlgR family response regulator transcription factor n=1 Tax=unclassified Siphonobacter TaxID=2635712 RepID=UPI000B9DDF3F|nr:MULTISPECIES: LytTR family DNA-binding domain-containing protein [unclassified Siphonobacter]OZI09475.1 DNA-binding response regulator [Siphonobacter sp. BAB-5385]PMD99233.1 DNA-binding response regulator [Siphonobacter sp. BAB-5405]
MKLKCVIVDDELMARLSLERLCEKREELEIIGIFDQSTEGLNFLREKIVDVLFLDVEMPGLSGLELLDQLSYMPSVILTTSKTEYAFDAFQYQVTDYLKKPISLPRFMQAVDKVIDKKSAVKAPVVPKNTDPNEIYVKTEGRYIRIEYDNILYVENVGDYVKIRTNQGSHIVYATMKNLEEKLNPKFFFRVHRSFIINLSKIVDIEESNLVIADKVIPISRANKPELLEKLNIL